MIPSSRSAPAKCSDPERLPTVAYFTNVYPKTSHTFIRNEIAALERQGLTIVRIAVRHKPEALVDPADMAEAARTHTLLDDPWALTKACLIQFCRNPYKVLSAVGLLLSTPRGASYAIKSIAYLIEACRLIDLAKANNVGHIHVHFGTNPATVARLARRMGGPGYSITVHGPDEFDAPVAIDLRNKIKDARFVVGVSDFGRGQLMRWASPLDWSKLAVVRCGVGREWDDEPADGLESHTLIAVARLSAQKGIPLLLEAVSALLLRRRDFCVRIIGDGEMRRALETTIVERGLSGHVQILGWRSSKDVRREISAARALVLPSFAEGLPVVLMEALAIGRPVIATAIAGIPELVDAQCGWLIRSGSVFALGAAMEAALDADRNTLDTMAACGRERVRRYHDVDTNAAHLARLLRNATLGLNTRRRDEPEDRWDLAAP